MQLDVVDIGKHYNHQWLFKNINFSLKKGKSIAITGKNGSGKSTLLQIVYGLVQADQGLVHYNHQSILTPQNVFAMTSPYLELPIDFSINEIHKLYNDLGKLNIGLDGFLEYSMFTKKQSVLPVKYFSSGMLQRLKTAFCMVSDSPILLLDEPLTNMDQQGEDWYKNCFEKMMSEKIILIASNNPIEYFAATNQIEII